MEGDLPRTSPVRRQKNLIKRGGLYEDIVNDDELARLASPSMPPFGIEGFRGSGSPSNIEFQGGVLEGTPEQSGFGSLGSSVPSRDQQAEGFVGTADGRHDGGVFR